MSETLANLHRKIEAAGELESVVRAMKAIAASSITQYERSVQSLKDYDRTIRMGLVAAFYQTSIPPFAKRNEKGRRDTRSLHVIFGSDQGLVGQFNDLMVDFSVNLISKLSGDKIIWAVGERVQRRLEDAGLKPQGVFAVPNSVSAITQLVGQILVKCSPSEKAEVVHPMYLFYNRPKSGAAYEAVFQRILPLDELWLRDITEMHWLTNNLPEVLGDDDLVVRILIREYLFVSLFKACAESLASENTSRMVAMQRAEKNIQEMRKDLSKRYHHLRQSSIDEELFDIISGFEALKNRRDSEHLKIHGM